MSFILSLTDSANLCALGLSSGLDYLFILSTWVKNISLSLLIATWPNAEKFHESQEIIFVEAMNACSWKWDRKSYLSSNEKLLTWGCIIIFVITRILKQKYLLRKLINKTTITGWTLLNLAKILEHLEFLGLFWDFDFFHVFQTILPINPKNKFCGKLSKKFGIAGRGARAKLPKLRHCEDVYKITGSISYNGYIIILSSVQEMISYNSPRMGPDQKSLVLMPLLKSSVHEKKVSENHPVIPFRWPSKRFRHSGPWIAPHKLDK